MIREIHGRLPNFWIKNIYTIKRYVKKDGWLAHHGLQRNGTNYLLIRLKSKKIDVINELDPARNFPQHKHFRWYSSKKNIPKFIVKQYYNNLTVRSVDELNEVCGYPMDTVHIVVQKEIEDAIVSLANWGIRCNWFSNKKNAVENFQNLKADYVEYYKFWNELAKSEPSRVVVLELGRLQSETGYLFEALKRIGIERNCQEDNLEVIEVPQSPKNRKTLVSKEDYELFCG